MDSVTPKFIYYSGIGFYDLQDIKTNSDDITMATVTNGIVTERWYFDEDKSTKIGTTLYLDEAPRRVEWKGSTK